MIHSLLLLLYVMLVVAATLVHDPVVLGVALMVVLVSSGVRVPRLAWRVLRASLPFVLAVTLGVLWLDPASTGSLLVIDLRVLLLVALAFRILPSLDLTRALGLTPTLRFVLVLVTSQVLASRRLFGDFRLALASRTARRVGLLTALYHGAATAAWFLRRAEHDAAEMTQALTTRGFFLDRD